MSLVSAHLAPSSPAIRLAEAETLGLLVKDGLVIAAGDWNAAPAAGTCFPPAGVSPAQARRKLDRRAACAIEEAGFTDVGARAGSLTPTVGYGEPGQLAYRCDRIYTTLPAQAIAGFEVITDAEPESDHRPVVAVFDLAAATEVAEDVPAAEAVR